MFFVLAGGVLPCAVVDTFILTALSGVGKAIELVYGLVGADVEEGAGLFTEGNPDVSGVSIPGL
jgi:hypothetical protein